MAPSTLAEQSQVSHTLNNHCSFDTCYCTHVCGNIAFTGCINVENSPVIYREVTRALENLVLTNELHLLYLVTPLDIRDSIEPEWMTYFKQVRIRQIRKKISRNVKITRRVKKNPLNLNSKTRM